MKAYGVPRIDDVEHPDKADLCLYARKSSVGRFPKKGGDYASSHRRAATKRGFRRVWKGKARAAARVATRALYTEALSDAALQDNQ